ncbi:isocitrate/isopropylmalate dehydrogenase family protein [Hymenobacter sp. BRD67]|uniref:isocitrate/isopropylmalate dehydrogenase family protein n=1 Tax=Hymenobacter sp. BRD67 TaxID=2675877 RepID=UPI001563DBD7|nr:isocitrate/isopropylmalate dehydrogenase family protein [Hymenobacter sp. BRD67]QKG54368.1 isocitrate/isopropylmalate dehydrogenase family protein [Hymenobacter sp. BRD67]
MHLVTLTPGDGIGPEITRAVLDIFAAAKVPVQWEEHNAGITTLESEGALLPQALFDSLERTRVGLKGPITTPVGKGFRSVNITLRQKYDLYQNLRPAKTTEGINTPFKGIDLVLFRENTEGLYSGLEMWDERLGIADSVSRNTVVGCRKICRAAFAYAAKHGRKHVTLAHKGNILKMAGKLMLDACKEAAAEFPAVTFYDDRIIDNMCMQLVNKPQQFDVIVTTNLFGDILSDLCAGLVGGLGVVAGANIGDDMAIFEAVHGSAPDIAGQGKANPTALLRSALLMLEHLGEKEHAARIEQALNETLKLKEQCTGDLGGRASTQEFARFVIEKL